MTEQQTLIGLSAGEWQDTTMNLFEVAGMPLSNRNDNPRNYSYTFNNIAKSLPVDFLFCRTKSIIQFLTDPDSLMKAATIGSDFAVENNYPITASLPLYELIPSFPQACLYIAATPNWSDVDKKNPNWKQLQGTRIFTPYPNIAKKYLDQREIRNITIEEAPGKIEGLYNAFTNNLAYIDIKSDKNKPPRTGEANGNIELAQIMAVDLVLVTRPDLTSIEQYRIIQLIQKFNRAKEQKEQENEVCNKLFTGSYRN